MSRTVKLTHTAQVRLNRLLEYLENEWSEKVKLDFIRKLDKRIEHVRIRPNLFQKSSIKLGLHKCVLSKQTTFFYIHKQAEITILTVFDTRQDPNKLKRHIKPN